MIPGIIGNSSLLQRFHRPFLSLHQSHWLVASIIHLGYKLPTAPEGDGSVTRFPTSCPVWECEHDGVEKVGGVPFVPLSS